MNRYRTLRALRRTAVGLVVLVLAALSMACVVYPARYVWRTLTLGNSDVDDQFRFPKRTIRASPGVGDMPLALDPERVRTSFSSTMPGQGLETWLAANTTQGFVVLQRGRVIYEGYFNDHRRDDTATSFSVAKSVLGTLVDLAVADGRIASIDLPVTTWLPELRQRDPRFERVSLRHLLNMNAGLRYTEYPFPTSDGAKTYYWPDLRALALSGAQIVQAPGQAWLYNNYHPLLIGLVLERTTGMSVTSYLEQRLWQPAGMAAAASWSLDSEASGFEKLESGINARTLDFARFGQLFLDEGVALDGRRIVSAEAVRAATSPDGAVPLEQFRGGAYYKHFWWGQRRSDGFHDFSARGNHGQFVFVSPRNQVVIARNGREYGVPPQVWIRLFEGLADRLGTNAGP